MAAFLTRFLPGLASFGRNVGNVRAMHSAKGSARFEVTNADEILRILKRLDEDYYRQFRQDVKDIAKPVQQGVQAELRKYTRASPPLSGMRQVHFGRVAWGTTYAPAGYPRPKPYDSALIDVPKNLKNNKYGYRPIARIVVGSPGTVLADMAGKSNAYTRKYPVTKVYDYMYTIRGQKVPGKRQHAITTQGLEMIANLPGRKPSRYVWLGAERKLPEARKAIDKSLSKINRYINAKLRTSA